MRQVDKEGLGQIVEVNLGTYSYLIYIQTGLLYHLGQLMYEAGLGKEVLLVTNPTVGGYYLHIVQKGLASAGFSVMPVEVPDGEEYKNLEWANCLYDAALKAGLKRNSSIVALGGGVIGDLAGFVASTYMRGIPFVQVPTTLLAQVDSSVGGKVAVNHPQGKNLIGAFYQPSLVLIDPNCLHTLPRRELVAGMAEVIKYGVIWDEEFFYFLEEQLDAILRLENQAIIDTVARCCKIKALIVEQDEKEYGIRTLLNLGHTFGHALEAQTHYQVYRHGEAVAIGMVVAGQLALELGWWTQAEHERMVNLLKKTGLPLTIPQCNLSELQQLMLFDKKALNDTLRWVLPCKLGKAEVTDQVPDNLVSRVLKKLFK